MHEDHQVPTVTIVLAKSLLAIRDGGIRVKAEMAGQSDRASWIHGYIFTCGMRAATSTACSMTSWTAPSLTAK